MDKYLIRGGILVFLTCVSFASVVFSNENTGTYCSDGLGLSYTLPMFNVCKKELHSNGSMVQTIPKLLPYTSKEAACPRRKSELGIPPGHRVCRFPDCGENTCQNGWCEETMENYKCQCTAGYRGKRCNEQTNTTQDTKTMSTMDTTTSHPITTTQSPNTLDTTTMSTSEAATSYPTTTTQSTTTQHTTTMSTIKATTSHPTTTTQSTTTQDTTTMSTMKATTSHPTTTTPSTAKIFVTDKSTENKIFVAYLRDDLVFTSIPSTKEPRYITYDSVERKLYWTDKDTKRVYRADEDGGNMEAVTSASGDELRGIAIAETSRTLYIANKSPKKITSVSIAQGSSFPGVEASFTSEFSEEPYSVEVDEEKGFLYWSVSNEILRKPLDKSSGRTSVYQNNDLSKITGLSLDLSRDSRRMFFCDFGEEKTFYQDIDTGSLPVIITGTSGEEKLRDVSYFNGALYWTKDDSQRGIAVLTNYDQNGLSFDIKGSSEIESPFQLVITNAEP